MCWVDRDIKQPTNHLYLLMKKILRTGLETRSVNNDCDKARWNIELAACLVTHSTYDSLSKPFLSPVCFEHTNLIYFLLCCIVVSLDSSKNGRMVKNIAISQKQLLSLCWFYAIIISWHIMILMCYVTRLTNVNNNSSLTQDGTVRWSNNHSVAR